MITIRQINVELTAEFRESFENRLQHVEELQRMGADIKQTGSLATIHGKLGKKYAVLPGMLNESLF